MDDQTHGVTDGGAGRNRRPTSRGRRRQTSRWRRRPGYAVVAGAGIAGLVLGALGSASALSSTLALGGGDTAHVTCSGPSLSVSNQTATGLDLTCTPNPTTTTTIASTTTTTGVGSGLPVGLDRMAAGFGPSSVTVTVVNSTSEIAVAWVAADGLSSAQTATVSDPTAGGLTWSLAGRSNAERGDAEVWWAKTDGKGFSARAVANDSGTNLELTVGTYTNAAGIGAVRSASAARGAPTVTLTPAATGSLVGAVGFDWDSATQRTVGAGQTLDAINTDGAGDTYWVQHALKTTTAGDAVTIDDSAPTTDRWNFEAVEIVPASGVPPTTTTVPATTTTTQSTGPGPSLDPSTPPMVAVSDNVTSVSSPTFSPPAGSLLYAAFPIDSPYIGEPGQTYVPHPHVAYVTNTGTPLAWRFIANESSNTAYVGGYVDLWSAPNPTAQSKITVTGTFAQKTKNVTPPVGAFQLLVVDHAAANQVGAAFTTAASMSGTTVASATVTAPARSLVLGVVDTWNSVDNPPRLPSNQEITGLVVNSTDVDSYWVQRLSAPTATAGSVTMSATLSRTDEWHEIAWVVLPA